MIDREVSQMFDRRSALFLGFGAVLTSALVLRMLQMQLFSYKDYKKKAESNSIRIQVNLPERGKILSKDGMPLARDVPVYRAYVIPSEAEDLDALLGAVKSELNLSAADIKKITTRINRVRRFQPTLIRESLDWEQLARLQTMGLSGLHIEPGFSRRYPAGPAAAHIIGYVSYSDRAPRAEQTMAARSPFFETGTAGLEKTMDEQLSGKAGQTVLVVDAIGRTISEDASMETMSIPGGDVKTTISESIQRALYDALVPAKSACGVVMDAESGNVIASVSVPSYNPEMFRTDGGPEYTEGLRRDTMRPFMNKAIEGVYPPGSTFKIVVALAALESGAITPGEKIFCPGYWDYGNHRYNCWEKRGHGWENLSDALKHSCDVYFYQVALRIGIDAIKNMALRLGFDQKLLGLFPLEATGNIPDRKWKEKQIGIKWVHGDTIISGIGQGFILSNCLQLATMMARVSTNKIIMPRLISGTDSTVAKGLGLQSKNIKYVLDGLEQVMKKDGTAAGYAINVNGKSMGGKTGTSQVRSISRAERESGIRSNEDLPWNLRNHGLFVGYAPTNSPKYVVAVITEHSGGSGPAASAAATVMRKLLK